MNKEFVILLAGSLPDDPAVQAGLIKAVELAVSSVRGVTLARQMIYSGETLEGLSRTLQRQP